MRTNDRGLLQGACLALCLVVVPLLLTAGGCFSSWFLLNNDVDGLPCADPDPADPTKPVCLAGYACIDGLCRKEAAKQKGDECNADVECAGGLVCRDIWDEDGCGGEVNCALGRERDPLPGRRCRTVCDPDVAVDEECAPGERCFFDPEAAVQGFCQSGTCATDSDCGTNGNLQNLCLTAVNPPGLSGLCGIGCDPLDCNAAGSCSTCPATDFDGDGAPDPQGCEPSPDSRIEQLRVRCVLAGTVPANQPCDDVNTFCEAGSFCFKPQGETVGFCSRWCNAQGGAPACDAAHPNCNQIAGAIGFCL